MKRGTWLVTLTFGRLDILINGYCAPCRDKYRLP